MDKKELINLGHKLCAHDDCMRQTTRTYCHDHYLHKCSYLRCERRTYKEFCGHHTPQALEKARIKAKRQTARLTAARRAKVN